ncbi:MAG: redoxin domain-containing protein [Hyphomicrobiaceae bacterium]
MPLDIALRLTRAAAIGAAMLMLAAPALARDSVRPGQPAPDFTATDTNGTPVTLGSLKGKTVVLEWTNHDCPYVRKHYGTGTMQKLQSDATSDGVIWLTVISSAPGHQGYVSDLEAEKLTSDRKAAPSGVLLDGDGKVGRLYGASTTPHMFVIDKTGALAYMGAIDDKPSTAPDTVKTARPYVREALAALREGKAVAAPASTRPYGCSVKYGAARG